MKKKILIIDDDSGVHSIINVIIQRQMQECTFLSAYNGEDGIRTALEEIPDAILLDVSMPGIDGFETCRRLKSDERTRHIPVIIFTGMATDSQGEESAADCGADMVLAKPLRKAILIEKLSLVLEGKDKPGKA